MKSFHTLLLKVLNHSVIYGNKNVKENPDLDVNDMTRPILTNALTHGLSLVADMFVDSDTLLLPTHN